MKDVVFTDQGIELPEADQLSGWPPRLTYKPFRVKLISDKMERSEFYVHLLERMSKVTQTGKWDLCTEQVKAHEDARRRLVRERWAFFRGMFGAKPTAA